MRGSGNGEGGCGEMKDERTVTAMRLMWSLNSGLRSKITFDTGARQLDNKIKISIILEIC
jgi:hypothetical protein